MLSISTPRKGADGSARYYTDDKAEYYLEGQAQFSRWFGQGAEALGLTGPVERAPFYHLLNGVSPEGSQPLVQNAGHADRQCCWDLTFSAPKSVSVLWALASEDVRPEIEQAHQRAVQRALEYVEDTAGLTRRGQGGHIQEQAALVFATFQEGTSRALDPQLHTHAVLINLGLRHDGTTGSLKTEVLFQSKMKAGALYQAELAAQLRERLGLELQRERVGFSVVGVPKELCQEFSKRRHAIEKAMQERGAANAVAAKIATLATRPDKEHVSAADLFVHWRQVAQQHGWSTEQAMRLLAHAREQSSPQQPRRHTQKESPRTQEPARENTAAAPTQRQTERSRAEHAAKSDAQSAQDRESGSAFSSGRRTEAGEDHQQPPRGRTTGRRQSTRGPAGNQSSAEQERASTQRCGPDRERSTGAARLLKRLIHVEWRPLFPKAPNWSPAKKWQAPVLVLGNPKPRRSKWGRVLWTKKLGSAELRLQERRAFPKAPKWSPVHDLKFRALRFVEKQPEWLRRLRTPPKTKSKSKDQTQSKSDGHSHSQ